MNNNNIKEKLEKSLLKLLGKPSLTRVNLSEVLEVFKDFIEDLDVQGLPYWMRNITLANLERYAQRHRFFVKPISGIAGYRIEKKEGKEVLIENKYHYKSVYETFLYEANSDPENILKELECDRKNILSEDTCLYGDFSGRLQRNISRKLLHGKSERTYVIRISLYADDFETGNPLGSKAGLHKLCGIYFSINNFGVIRHQSITNMFALFYSLDINNLDYEGIDLALRPFVNEMKELAAPRTVYVGNQKITVMFRMAFIVGDALGMHQMMDIMAPSSRHFCKICWITKELFKQNPTAMGEIRTPENYLDKFKDFTTQRYFNIKKNSILNELDDYNINNNWTSDLLHDFLEGNTKLIINDVCNFIYKEGLLTEKELNQRIDQFNYGHLFATKKPTASIFKKQISGTKTIKQSGYQTLLLMQTLPFMIMDKLLSVTEENSIYNMVQDIILLISNHLEILSIVMSPIIPLYEALHLKNSIHQYIDLYCSVFGTNRVINKTHHILHFPQCIIENGPPLFYSCAKYENNHLWQKTYAHISNNRKDLTKSLSYLDSYRLLYKLVTIQEKNETYKIYPRGRDAELELNKKIFPTLVQRPYVFTHVNYKNEEFRKGMYICIKKENVYGEKVLFGKIQTMSMINEKLYFHFLTFETIEFNHLFWGYQISEITGAFNEIEYDALPVKKAFCPWYPYSLDYIIIARTTSELLHH